METICVRATECGGTKEHEVCMRDEAVASPVVQLVADGEDGDGVDERRDNRSGTVCEECGNNLAKYRCPACALRSCGLSCVRAHKERTGCTGKRDRTAFVPLSDYDDNLLISDYNLLEESLRITDSAKRIRDHLGSSEKKMSSQMIQLRNQAANRNIKIFFLANGMSRRETNTAFYNRRFKCIFWKVEWRFDSTEVNLVDHRVDENLKLEKVLEKHLAAYPGNALVRHKLRQFLKEPLQQLKLLMKKEPCSVSKEEYFELNMSEPLRKQLAYKSIYEYPIVNVVLPSEAHKFKIISESIPSFRVPEAPKVNSMPYEAHAGTYYQEEEIEEGEIVE
ncbi:hypothetical protein O6H91_17G034100 [Diphasiastrum complanatum]|uniref:Uncharacterized protein n=1 Tax=Diphasiastrum complanatum TaxID=34168 RepID=A0ACC2B5L4_DIPCM|nr:hypothetical protein O6H91_17G034100 [Diphasiastrum complanatum]